MAKEYGSCCASEYQGYGHVSIWYGCFLAKLAPTGWLLLRTFTKKTASQRSCKRALHELGGLSEGWKVDENTRLPCGYWPRIKGESQCVHRVRSRAVQGSSSIVCTYP